MTTTPPTEVPQQPLARQRAEISGFDPNDPVALYMNPSTFEQLQRVAAMMAQSTFVPDHFRAGFTDRKGVTKDLKTATGDCFLVAAQAFRWGMDPFAVAQDTFVIGGKLGYGGKVIGAVVNVHRRVEAELDYAYSGEGDKRKIVASATLRGVGVRTVEGTVGQWKTDNDKWCSQPDQQLAYRANREWARRWIPEAILGVTAEEDVAEVVDVTPVTPVVAPIDAAPEPPKGLAAVTEKLKAKSEKATPEPGPDRALDPSATACPHKGIRELVAKGLIKVDELPNPCSSCGQIPTPYEMKAMLPAAKQ